MIFIGSAGSRMFVICARMRSDSAAMAWPRATSAAVYGVRGAGDCAVTVNTVDASARVKARNRGTGVPPDVTLTASNLCEGYSPVNEFTRTDRGATPQE